MKRRLDIALGLVHRPRVLFLDEPTTGLDPEARVGDVGRGRAARARRRALTILLTTHYLEEADQLADRLAIVAAGKVVVEGTPDELKATLRGDAVHVELADGDGSTRRAGVVRALDGAPRGRRSTGGTLRRARRRTAAAALPGDPLRARRARASRVASVTVAPAVARRRLPPLHRPRLRDRGRRRRQ